MRNYNVAVKEWEDDIVFLRKIIPGYGGMDVAALVAVVALIVFKLVLVSLLAMGAMRFSPLQLLVVTVTEVARLLLDYLFWTIILRIILSWVAPDPRNPVVQLVAQITEPVMAPARKLLPPLGGLDLSPIIVLLAIKFIKILFGL